MKRSFNNIQELLASNPGTFMNHCCESRIGLSERQENGVSSPGCSCFVSFHGDGKWLKGLAPVSIIDQRV